MKIVSRTALVLTFLMVFATGAFFLRPLWFFDELIRLHLWQQGVRSHYVQVDGRRIHYFEARPPRGSAGTPLLLIHGLGARGEDWSGMIPTLAAQGFHVYVPDLLGYGRSARPDIAYSISDQEKLIVDLMSTLGIARADAAGWSMGGWIALRLTVDHPDLVDRLALLDSAGIYFKPTYDASLFTPTDAAGVFRLQTMLSPHPRPLPAFIDRDALRKLGQSAWIIDRSVSSMLSGRELTDARLSAITQPALIVWGEQDRLIPLPVGEQMHREIPNSQLLVVQGCGHLAPAECARPVLHGLIHFLEDPAPTAGQRVVPGHGQ